MKKRVREWDELEAYIIRVENRARAQNLIVRAARLNLHCRKTDSISAFSAGRLGATGATRT